jgi:hypothetical protein
VRWSSALNAADEQSWPVMHPLIALTIALATCGATMAGGLLAMGLRDRLHLVMGGEPACASTASAFAGAACLLLVARIAG